MDGFSEYIKDILRYPLLTKNQEILLARQVQGDDNDDGEAGLQILNTKVQFKM